MSIKDHGLSEENSNESITDSELCLYRTVICLKRTLICLKRIGICL